MKKDYYFEECRLYYDPWFIYYQGSGAIRAFSLQMIWQMMPFSIKLETPNSFGVMACFLSNKASQGFLLRINGQKLYVEEWMQTK